MFKRFSTAARIVTLTVMTVAFTACGAAQTATPEPPKTTINYQLGWVHEYSSAMFYVAIANGHYAEQGLDVNLLTGGFSEAGVVDSVEVILSGEADFGTVSISALLQAREQGKPLVAIASITQHSPNAIISLAEAEIVRPQDMVGKTIAVAEGGARLNYDALLSSQDIDPADVNTVVRSSFGIDPLLNNEVDALVGWMINEGVQITESGQEPNIVLLADYGIDTYDLLVVTTEDRIANEPDLVERFLRGTLNGVQDMVENPETAVDLILNYDDQLDREGQARRLEAFIPLINPSGTNLGSMNPEVWAFNYELQREGGILTQDQEVSEAYTTRFLDAIYSS